ncbi:type 1 fimbrial protein [Salmonella enterica subsp. enterica]|nr:type 1 fimbrial protein [Salmonella enterica subsp. enterica serovar Lexington]EGZ4041076.1 type 1 fimbrial protein [Salmonella enterica subsp. enterica serovar Lexington]
MRWSIIFLSLVCAQAVAMSPSFPPLGMSLPEYWGEENVWWHGRATFSGKVIVPACTLAMEDAWQSVDMGETPVRELQNGHIGPGKMFQLRLRDCELAETGKRVFTGNRVRVTFDGIHGENPEQFSTTGQATGVDLQIRDEQGYPARAGKVMPPLQLTGNEQGLNYTLQMVRNGKPLSAGSFYAALRFKVDYE